MSLDAWLLFCATDIVLCFIPGPAVLLVVTLTLTAGAAAATRGIGGILAANAGYFVLSAAGIGAVLLASWSVFSLVRWLGAAYLAWLGVAMLLARADAPGSGDSAPASARASRTRRPFVSGVVTQGANPANVTFFTALLPQFIDPEASVARQLAILGATSLLIELGVLAAYVSVGSRVRRSLWTPALATSVQRAGGALLLCAAAGLATLRRA
ncbi:MAG: LysE family translocator [Thermodesulfobacteriota bacterium]